MKKHIPNTITLLNLLTGFIGIILLLQGNIIMAARMIFLAAVFDFLDGFAARILKAYSDVGKSLDSLADMISFGVLPGLIVYALLEKRVPGSEDFYGLLPYIAVIIPACAALRLAIFNNDDSQKTTFKGLATPAMALFFAGLAVSYEGNHEIIIRDHYLLLMAFTLALSVLMLAPVKMFSFKIKNFKARKSIPVYVLIILAPVLILTMGYEGVSLSVILYIILSLL